MVDNAEQRTEVEIENDESIRHTSRQTSKETDKTRTYKLTNDKHPP
jgi:hypothetical protein